MDLEFIKKATKQILRKHAQANPSSDLHITKLSIYKHALSIQGKHSNVIENLIDDSIQELSVQDSIGAEIITKRFINNFSLTQVAFKLNLSIDQISRKQRSAINSIARILMLKEETLNARTQSDNLASLPAKTYDHFFGHEKEISKLFNLLISDQKQNAVSVSGLGGIGKTALTDCLVRQLISKNIFDNVYWIRAPNYQISNQQVDSTIRFENILQELAMQSTNRNIPPIEYLKEIKRTFKPYNNLVVIDNFDINLAPPNVNTALSEISAIAKVIVTSRQHSSQTQNIFSVQINELDIAESKMLLVYQAKSIGKDSLVPELESVASQIYSLVGGNPLALKIIVGLLEILPFKELTKDIKGNQQGVLKDIYQTIFNAAWETLSESSKRLLSVFPFLGPQGGSFKRLADLSKLPSDSITASLQELHSRSLIEIRGDLKEKYYGIHKLTDTYLRTNVINL